MGVVVFLGVFCDSVLTGDESVAVSVQVNGRYDVDKVGETSECYSE